MTAGRIRPRLVAVWLLLAALVAVIAIAERGAPIAGKAAPARDVAPRLLLPAPVEQLAAVEVASGGTLHRFERDPAGAWLYHAEHGGAGHHHVHQADPSSAARIGETLAAFGRTRIEREVVADKAAADYGVAAPAIVILVYGPGDPKPLMQYAVGDVAPDTVSRYVAIVGRSTVVTVPSYQIDNLLAMIDAVRPKVPPPRRGK